MINWVNVGIFGLQHSCNMCRHIRVTVKFEASTYKTITMPIINVERNGKKPLCFRACLCDSIEENCDQQLFRIRSQATSFPGSLILPPRASEERPWLGLVTCVPESGT